VEEVPIIRFKAACAARATLMFAPEARDLGCWTGTQVPHDDRSGQRTASVTHSRCKPQQTAFCHRGEALSIVC
jgi:hypothetical protein